MNYVQAGLGQDGLDVFEDPGGLLGDSAGNQLAGGGIEGDLSGCEKRCATRIACEYGPIAAGASLVEMAVFVFSLIYG